MFIKEEDLVKMVEIIKDAKDDKITVFTAVQKLADLRKDIFETSLHEIKMKYNVE